VFAHLKAELGQIPWVDKDPEHEAEHLLIEMYHSKTLPKNKTRVVSSLNGDGNYRVFVATTSLGMGLDFRNISHVVMYGPPGDLEDIQGIRKVFGPLYFPHILLRYSLILKWIKYFFPRQFTHNIP
jgi:hypothetical protein